MISNFHERRYWSMFHKADVLRLAAVGSDGFERWVIVPLDCGSAERRRRQALAEQALTGAVRRGLPPGELTLDYAEINHG